MDPGVEVSIKKRCDAPPADVEDGKLDAAGNAWRDADRSPRVEGVGEIVHIATLSRQGRFDRRPRMEFISPLVDPALPHALPSSQIKHRQVVARRVGGAGVHAGRIGKQAKRVLAVTGEQRIQIDIVLTGITPLDIAVPRIESLGLIELRRYEVVRRVAPEDAARGLGL